MLHPFKLANSSLAVEELTETDLHKLLISKKLGYNILIMKNWQLN